MMVFGLSSSDGSSSEDEVADREVLPPSSISPSTPAPPAADSGGAGGGASSQPRRSGREPAPAHPSPLDRWQGSDHPVDGANSKLTFRVESASAPIEPAKRVLKSAFASCDDNLIELRGEYRAARRILLLHEGRCVAALVGFAHEAESVLEVPLLGVEQGRRKQGLGTLLVAVAMQLSAKLRLTYFVVSATDEARKFWYCLGLDLAGGKIGSCWGGGEAKAVSEVREAVRVLSQSGKLHQYGESTVLGRLVDQDSMLRNALDRMAADQTPAEEIGAEEAERCDSATPAPPSPPAPPAPPAPPLHRPCTAPAPVWHSLQAAGLHRPDAAQEALLLPLRRRLEGGGETSDPAPWARCAMGPWPLALLPLLRSTSPSPSSGPPQVAKCELPAWNATTGQGFKRTPYKHLRAFDKGGAIGYGVRCTSALVHNQVVGEFVGQWLNVQEVAHLDSLVGHEADERTKYLVAFDEKTLERKKASGDSFRYIDCREHGNMMRLLNDCQDAPNCELMAWPRPDPARGIEPKALFLVARHDVPASVELVRGC